MKAITVHQPWATLIALDIVIRWGIGMEQESKIDCTSCYYYSELKTQDVLHPDKTVTKGRVAYKQCLRGNFKLVDLLPCELYRKRTSQEIMLPPIPPFE